MKNNKMMIKPEKLKKGDKVAVVSLSSGMLGEPNFMHKYHIAKKRLEEEFGLKVVAMPNALKGENYLFNHPQARAEDLMNALKDKSIKAIICAIGGEETYRLLPYVDFDAIKQNPKIFMGFSDSTVNHLMFYKAGVISFYGPCIMCNFGEYVKMFDYEKEAVQKVLFNSDNTYQIKPSPRWSNETVWWMESNINVLKKTLPDDKGYQILQGKGKVRGRLLGGCFESLCALLGVYDNKWYESENEEETKQMLMLAEEQKILAEKYDLFPSEADWENKILFVETSELFPTPENLEKMLKAFIDKGIIERVNGIIVGKPKEEKYFEEYKEVYKRIVGQIRPDLPIIYNVNFGHAQPINIIPYGVECELDCDKKTITIVEKMLRNDKELKKEALFEEKGKN